MVAESFEEILEDSMMEEQDQQEVLRVQRAIMQVLREYKARGVETVEESTLCAEVERRLGIIFHDDES